MLKKRNRLGEIDIFSNPKGATGFVAEIVWGFNSNLTGIESKVIGAETYKKGSNKGQKLGSDIKFTSKEGRQYYIQSKNTFYPSGPIYTGGGTLDNVLDKISKVSPTSDAVALTDLEVQILKYNLLNSKMFNNVGGLKQVSILLNNGILHFLKMESIETLENSVKKGSKDISNLFYIYKGTYLIPISDFLTTVRDLMIKMEGLFKLNLSDISIKADLPSIASNLLYEKEIVKKLNPQRYPGQFMLGRYSDSMLAVGISEGEYLTSKTEINNIKIFAKEIRMLIDKAMTPLG
jgi:hypothetical protein